MSYCRCSCDDWLSNVYVIGDVRGGFCVMVSCLTIADPKAYQEQLPPLLPEPTCEDSDEVWEAYDDRADLVLELYQATTKVDLNHPMAGESLGAKDYTECIALLERLRSEGLHVPQHALDRLHEELKEGELHE